MTAIDVVRLVPVTNGVIDRAAVAALIPEAVVDVGGRGWPAIVNDVLLLPTIWQALSDITDILNVLAAALEPPTPDPQPEDTAVEEA